MTINEAIRKLELLRSYQATYDEDSADCKALDMAIEALKDKSKEAAANG